MSMNKVLALKGLLALVGLYIAYKLGLELWCIVYGLVM